MGAKIASARAKKKLAKKGLSKKPSRKELGASLAKANATLSQAEDVVNTSTTAVFEEAVYRSVEDAERADGGEGGKGEGEADSVAVRFGARLAHSEKKVRDKGFKALQKWLAGKTDLEAME